jgi:hypothetical protein
MEALDGAYRNQDWPGIDAGQEDWTPIRDRNAPK